MNSIRNTVKKDSAKITVIRAVQEKMLVVLSSSLADAHGARAMKFVSKFMFVKTAEFMLPKIAEINS